MPFNQVYPAFCKFIMLLLRDVFLTHLSFCIRACMKKITLHDLTPGTLSFMWVRTLYFTKKKPLTRLRCGKKVAVVYN